MDHATAEAKALEAANILKGCYEHQAPVYGTYNGIEIRSDTVSGIYSSRFMATGLVPIPRRKMVQDVMAGGERRSEWNLSWDSTDLLESWDSSDGKKHFAVFQDKLKGALGGLISARDMVEVRVFWHEEDSEGGKSWVAFQSVEDPRKPPQDVVRGFMYPSGSVAKAVSENDPNHSSVFSVVHCSVGGSIPNWIASKGVVSELSYYFANITKAFSHP